MRATTICGIWVLLAIAAVHPGYAQQYFFSSYTPKNGLVNNRVSTVFQDSRGRLYVGTYGGLSIYDGTHFINYTAEDGLAMGLINDIVEMGDDSLWIIQNTNTLQCLVHGMLRNIPTADHFCPIINQLIKCSDGYYYAIADDGLFRLQNNRFVRIPLKNARGMETGRYLAHATETHGRLFIVNDPNLENVIPAASMIVYDLRSKKCIVSDSGRSFFYVALSPAKDILVSTRQGIFKLDTATLYKQRIHLLPAGPSYAAAGTGPCKSMYVNSAGNIWVSTDEGIVRIDKQGHVKQFTSWNGLQTNGITCMLEDREKNMWFGSEQNGILKLVNQEVQLYHEYLPGFVTTDIYASPGSDSVWLFDQPHWQLLLLAGNKQQLFHGEGKVPLPRRLLISKKAYLLGIGGVYELRFEGQHFRAVPIYRSSTPMDGYFCFDRNGDLINVSTKLTVIVGKKIFHQDLPTLADQAGIDRDNRIWLITRTNELFVFRLDSLKGDALRLQHHYANVLLKGSPRSLAVDHAGQVWIGTRDNGVFCLGFDHDSIVSRRQVTMLNGLSENFINYLHCDANNTMWACTHTGLDRIRQRDSGFMVENVTPYLEHYETIFKIVSSAGPVQWAIAGGGIMKIALADRSGSRYRPGILFSKVLVADQAVPAVTGGRLSLPYDRNTLSFDVGVPTFVNEGQTRYSYLLEGGRDGKWSPPSTRADINLVNLPPGQYKLRVKAEFLTGRYPLAEAAYPFVIRPPWWQTWWFRIITALAGALVIGLWISHYIRSKLEIQWTRMEKEQAVDKERTRIATDMHDDLGAGLSRIKFLSETIHLKRQRGQPVGEDLSSISRYANEMIDKMGEIVWALNQKNDSLSDLLAYARSYAVDYLLHSGISCAVDTKTDESINRFVSGEFRRNVYLTIKEALHNVVKHAHARQVRICIEAGKDVLMIAITDDGIGFDPDAVRATGNGLSNMQQRIRAIGGQLQIQSCGRTVVQLKVPLPL
jgi:signal transduction histidine kinase/ligand-binding sensor domain-containing protein